jgi:phosphoglycolate phosphatase
MKDRFDLLIFDWDGTLVDSIDWIVQCVQSAAIENECPVPPPQAAKDIIGLSIQEAVSTLFPKADDFMQQQLIRSYSQRFFSKQTTSEDLFAGVEDMLKTLKQAGYKLAVATGKNRAGLNKVLQGTGIEAFFDITRCADETASKPHPLMLEEIMQFTGINSARALMIGDSIHDLQMAQNAQMAAIGVTCGAHSKEILQQYQPLFCLEQTTELLELITG